MHFQPNEKFWRAVLNLQASEDFKTIRMELQKYQLMAGIKFPVYEGSALAQLQGRAALAIELLQKFDPDLARQELARLDLRQKEADQKPVY